MRALQSEQAVAYVRQAEQKSAPKSSEELLEVHRGARQDRVDLISGNALQPITFQPAFVLQMSDAWFDRGTAFHRKGAAPGNKPDYGSDAVRADVTIRIRSQTRPWSAKSLAARSTERKK